MGYAIMKWLLFLKNILERFMNVKNAKFNIPLISVKIPIQKTGYNNMNMKLRRKIYTHNSTIGQLTFNNNSLTLWTLEPPQQINGTLPPFCIPSGMYKIGIYDSPKFKIEVPVIKDVPGRENIEIHIGNYMTDQRKDSEGCILVGKNHSVDFIGESKIAFNEMIPIIKEGLSRGDVTINIIG